MMTVTYPETGEQAAKAVEQVFVHDDTVFDLVIDGEVISTTEDHPFWSITDQKFERADELDSGEEVLGANGQALTIGALKLETHRETLAYNLSVEGIHTYHVGTTETLVHNVCGDETLEALAKIPGEKRQNRHANAAAKILGYSPYTGSGSLKGQLIFERKNKYISTDIDDHNGGFWKMALKPNAFLPKSAREGTFDIYLKRRVRD